MVSKEHIVQEIRRIAGERGNPPGRRLFERETGIKMAEWYDVHWRSWGDALREAGFRPNRKQTKLDSGVLLSKFAEAVRHFGRVPAEIDIRMYSREREDFPGHTTFSNHFGNKSGLLIALAEWVGRNPEFADIVEHIPVSDNQAVESPIPSEGFVYLLKSGDFYKIGRSAELEKRVKQISVSLPERVELEHSIRTDDPVGIEQYWHRRFHEKRANGEWFRLSRADVRAFKKRRFQ
jgi:hypothetical protein